MSNVNFCSGNHILVGLGGTGGKILRAVKMRMFEEFHSLEERSNLPISYLYVDSTTEMMPVDGRARADFRVMGQDASFTNDKFFNIKAVDVGEVLDHIDSYPSVKGIVDNVQAVKQAIGSLGHAAGQKRRAGRLLFAANAVGYVNSLRGAYRRCENVSNNADKTTIYIFAGLAGGTGSGAIIDTIIQTRKAFPSAKILVFAMLPELHLPKDDMDQGRYYPNGYAALEEINALQTGRWFPHDVTGSQEARLYNDRVKGVADGITIYSNINDNGYTVKDSLKDLPQIVGDFIFSRIFLINDEDMVNRDMLGAFNFENMDDFALEYDETAIPDERGVVPVARTKKINSFGLKRVVYPELRILKHITYSVGESVLYQLRYNNWRENQGYVNEEKNKDYRREYLNKENLRNWMLDEAHLILDEKVLDSDPDYPAISDYWRDKAMSDPNNSLNAKNPLSDLYDTLGVFYDMYFREEGVEKYYSGKERVVKESAREIVGKIERALFEKWNQGDISIEELLKVSKLLLEKIREIRKELETAYSKTIDNLTACEEEIDENNKIWANLGISRFMGKDKRIFGKHQTLLGDYYTEKTRKVALDFAQKLSAEVAMELGRMYEDITLFSKKIIDALKETERLVFAHQKINKGLEDLKGIIVEVSEEDSMEKFEAEIKVDKTEMPEIARQIRAAILPDSEFINFGRLASAISVEEIIDTFDLTLSRIVETRHSKKSISDHKVLGLNILSQLKQQLLTDDDIKAFAAKIISQSGVFLKLDDTEVKRHLNNNEGNLSPSEPASINKRTILISMPAPDKDETLQKFAEKLQRAFKSSISQDGGKTSIEVNMSSPRKNELSIVSIRYCFPLRTVKWLHDYKAKYDQFLSTGNQATDKNNRVLLYGEKDGTTLPSLPYVENWKEIVDKKKQKLNSPVQSEFGSTQGMPPKAASVPPPVVGNIPIPNEQPQISLYIAVNGQSYGPYDYATCRELVKNRQLVPESQVWMEGMSNWQQASQVAMLNTLFAPAPPSTMPPMPGAFPPPIV